MVRIHSPRPNILPVIKRMGLLVLIEQPDSFHHCAHFCAPLCFSCARHRVANSLRPGVNVASGGAEVAVAGEVRQGVRVHVFRPAGDAGVAESVKWERGNLGDFQGLWMLRLQSRFLRVAARPWRRKTPSRLSWSRAAFLAGRPPRSQRNRASGSSGLTPASIRIVATSRNRNGSGLEGSSPR